MSQRRLTLASFWRSGTHKNPYKMLKNAQKTMKIGRTQNLLVYLVIKINVKSFDVTKIVLEVENYEKCEKMPKIGENDTFLAL